jgi:hypothetical protein
VPRHNKQDEGVVNRVRNVLVFRKTDDSFQYTEVCEMSHDMLDILHLIYTGQKLKYDFRLYEGWDVMTVQ